MRTTTSSLLAICGVSLAFTVSYACAQQHSSTAAADQLYNSHDWVKAAAAYEMLTHDTPTDDRAWARLGVAEIYNGAYERAALALEKAVALSNRPETSYNLAIAYAKTGNPDRAFALLHNAIAAGFRQLKLLKEDADLDSLRADKRFANVLHAAETVLLPCSTQPEYREFDFWIGRWDVTVAGRHVGVNVIDTIANDCSLLENWSSDSGTAGKSLNFYNPNTGQWQQTWIGGDASPLNLFGKFDGDAMRFSGETIKKDGSKTFHRLTFFKLENDQVRQLGEESEDGGKTWQTGWDGLYTRQK